MKIIKSVTQSEVFSHWEKVEKISITQRADIVFPLIAYGDLIWNLAKVEDADVEKIYICSSDDWKSDGLCVPDFKLTTAIENYKKSDFSQGKYADIKAKEEIFLRDINGLDTRLILVGDNLDGAFTLIEGCKRSIALGNLEKLVGLEIYVGISPAIKSYIWSRYA
jgi:hypothetical protein